MLFLWKRLDYPCRQPTMYSLFSGKLFIINIVLWVPFGEILHDMTFFYNISNAKHSSKEETCSKKSGLV